MKVAPLHRISLGALTLLCLGSLVSTLAKNGGWDFQTYHYAAGQALRGDLSRIYSHYLPPNPWLYAPGLAVWLIPLALLPQKISLILWSLAETGVIVGVAYVWARRIGMADSRWAPIAAFAPLLMARPLVYIFTHGTIDFYLFAACLWALLTRVDPAPGKARTIFSWALLTLLAVAKPMVLPLMTVPWLAGRGMDRRVVRWERCGQAVGMVAAVLPVWLLLGFRAGSELHAQWVETLVVRGMPIDTQNQSVAAFLYRWLTDIPVGALSLATGPYRFGFGWLPYEAVTRLVSGWTVLALAVGLAWQVFGRRIADPLTWVGGLLAWVVMPSHFAWKAYFVFGIPALGLALAHSARDWKGGTRFPAILLGLGVLVVNFSTADFVGAWPQAYLEAASVLVWVHVLALVIALRRRPLAFGAAT